MEGQIFWSIPSSGSLLLNSRMIVGASRTIVGASRSRRIIAVSLQYTHLQTHPLAQLQAQPLLCESMSKTAFIRHFIPKPIIEDFQSTAANSENTRQRGVHHGSS